MAVGRAAASAKGTKDANDTTDAVAREAWGLVLDLFFRHGREQMFDACEAVGLTPGLMRALLSLAPGEGRPMKLLAGSWRCEASHVTSLVDGLEQRGLAERRGHPTDRRVKTVVLTAAGERTRDELLRRLHQPPPFFASLTAAEARTLRHILGKLTAAVAGER
jgi:MarR family transcriptional regulator, organic hydroperoxide resistance regulator